MIIPLSAAIGAAYATIGARDLTSYDPSPFTPATVPGTGCVQRSTVAALAAAGAVLFAVLASQVSSPTALLAWFALAGPALWLVAIDACYHRLPNAVVIPALLVGVAVISSHGFVTGDTAAVFRALAGGAALFGIYLVMALVTPSGIGMGDVKLAAVVGLYLGWLGWEPWLYGAAGGFVIGAAVSTAVLVKRMLLRGRSTPTHVAFGPSMLASVLAIILIYM